MTFAGNIAPAAANRPVTLAHSPPGEGWPRRLLAHSPPGEGWPRRLLAHSPPGEGWPRRLLARVRTDARGRFRVRVHRFHQPGLCVALSPMLSLAVPQWSAARRRSAPARAR